MDDDDGVHRLLAAGLEQQRNVEHDDVGVLRLFEEAMTALRDQGMDDGFQPLQLIGVADDAGAERGAVDAV